jgi:hypothetical protein
METTSNSAHSLPQTEKSSSASGFVGSAVSGVVRRICDPPHGLKLLPAREAPASPWILLVSVVIGALSSLVMI